MDAGAGTQAAAWWNESIRGGSSGRPVFIEFISEGDVAGRYGFADCLLVGYQSEPLLRTEDVTNNRYLEQVDIQCGSLTTFQVPGRGAISRWVQDTLTDAPGIAPEVELTYGDPGDALEPQQSFRDVIPLAYRFPVYEVGSGAPLTDTLLLQPGDRVID